MTLQQVRTRSTRIHFLVVFLIDDATARSAGVITSFPLLPHYRPDDPDDPANEKIGNEVV